MTRNVGCACLLWIQEQIASSDQTSGGSDLVFWVCVATAGIVWLLLYTRGRNAFEAFMHANGFKDTFDKLPEGLVPPPNAWTPPVTVSDTWQGEHNGFQVAFFRTTIGTGDASLISSALAVRRPPVAALAWSNMPAPHITLDQHSTPGWIIASWKGRKRHAKWLEPILRKLTDAGVG